MADETPSEQGEQSAQFAAEAHAVALAQALHQHGAAREFAIGAMDRGDFTQTQAADYMLAFSREVVRAKDAGAGTPSTVERPRPHHDPALAAAGIREPEGREAGAVAARLESLGMDPQTWTPEDRALVSDVSQVTPPEILGDAVNLIRDAGDMEAAARAQRYSEKTAEAALRERWGTRYDERIEWATIVFNQLPARSQQYLRARGLNTWPAFVDRLATLGEKFLNTDDGIRWRLAQATEDAEAEERERAEEREQERKADERFGFGRGR